MRKVIEEKTLYKFDELPEDGKKYAIEKWREGDEFFHDFIIDGWEEKLEEFGFTNSTIYYRGFWSQGDGASFTCDSVSVYTFIEKLLTEEIPEEDKKKLQKIKILLDKGIISFYAKIYRSDNMYYHENTASLEFYIEFDAYTTSEKVETIYESYENFMADYIEQYRINFSREIYKELENEYDNQNSDETITETIIYNDYEFLIDGTMY